MNPARSASSGRVPRERRRRLARPRPPTAAATAGCAGTCARPASSPSARRTRRTATRCSSPARRAASATWNADTVDALYHCADCGCCESHCATHQPLPEAIVGARAGLAEAGLAPAAALEVKARLERWGSVHGDPGTRPAPAVGPVGLFVGDLPAGDDPDGRRGAPAAVARRPAGGDGRRRPIDRPGRQLARLRRHGQDAGPRRAGRRRGLDLHAVARPRSRRSVRVRARLRRAGWVSPGRRASASARSRPRWPKRTPAARSASRPRPTPSRGPIRSPTTPSASASGRGPGSCWPPRSATPTSAGRCAGTSGPIRAARPAGST